MSSVIDFAAAKDARQPHVSGEARCLGCRHEWLAVAPDGAADALECPACGLPRGRFKYLYAPPVGTAVWSCACGCDLFYRLSTGHLLCPNCGVFHDE